MPICSSDMSWISMGLQQRLRPHGDVAVSAVFAQHVAASPELADRVGREGLGLESAEQRVPCAFRRVQPAAEQFHRASDSTRVGLAEQPAQRRDGAVVARLQERLGFGLRPALVDGRHDDRRAEYAERRRHDEAGGPAHRRSAAAEVAGAVAGQSKLRIVGMRFGREIDVGADGLAQVAYRSCSLVHQILRARYRPMADRTARLLVAPCTALP